MFTPLLLSTILLCNPVQGVPWSAEPTAANLSPVRPVVEITPAPTMPPVVELLRRGGSNPAMVPRDDSDLMKRLVCGVYYVTCDSGSCCYLGQECYKNSAGADNCRYPGAIDYASLLSSLTAIYGGYGGNSYGYGGVYSSILSSYMDLLTKSLSDAGSPTGGHSQPVSTGTAGTGSPGSNSGSDSGFSSGSTITNDGGKKKSNTGMIAGIAVGSVVGVAIVGAIVWYCCRKKRNPTPLPQQYPQPQPAYYAQADIKPPQVYQFQHQPLPAEVGGVGIVPQQQVPPGNAVYAAQGTGYQGPISPPPPPQPSAQEMSGDTQLLPPRQHQQQPQYGPPRNGTPGPLVEMDAGQSR